MDYRKLGSLVRAVRRRQGWRQVDVAARARVSQSTLSRIERGDGERVDPRLVEAVAAVLRIRLRIEASWRGALGDALVDAVHSRLVEAVVEQLVANGWTVKVEVSFNARGEVGIVDILGWKGLAKALAVFEVKSELGDLQQTNGRIDIKRRVLPAFVARTFGSQAESVASILVVRDSGRSRRIVAEHAATFGAAFPSRTVAVRKWLRDPEGDLRAIWFLPDIPAETLGQKRAPRVRVQKPRDPGRGRDGKDRGRSETEF